MLECAQCGHAISIGRETYGGEIGGLTSQKGKPMPGHGKTKIVSFRLSETEYRYLQDLTAAKGARTLSEITRLVMCNMIDDAGSEAPETLARRIGQLDRNVAALNAEIRELAMAVHAALKEMPGKAEGKGSDPNDDSQSA